MNVKLDAETKALIFDLDGTLLDTMAVHRQAWAETLADYGIDMTEELFATVAGRTSAVIVEELNGRFGTSMDPGAVSLAKDQAYIRHASLIRPIPAVLEIARDYQAAYPYAAATNENFGISTIVLRTSGLASLFQTVVTADDVARPKPAPDIFLECADRLNVAPEKCHVFEDSVFGLEAARAAGMRVTDVADLL